MRELDKQAMGKRIRQIRLGQGLRQWELARSLGTTQSAVHKYEHGVIPEPRRLIELARIGNTTIEWVLTGQHWENGSSEQARLADEELEMACRLRELSQEGRKSLDDALRICREAMHAIQLNTPEAPGAGTLQFMLAEHGPNTLRIFETAWRIQRAVLDTVTEAAGDRLENTTPKDRLHQTGSD
jgi:transcriptional regulator with XRE-family HTH domain